MPRLTQTLTALTVASLLAWPAAASADLVVLQYHHVANDTPRATSTSPELFEQQLDYLEELDLPVTPLLESTRDALDGAEAERNRVAITFDDAYESVYHTAAPLLADRDMPYTIFVNTDAVGRSGYMTWKQLDTLANNQRVTIANHSADHGHLARKPDEEKAAWQARINASLDQAQETLERELGQDVPMFAYPYGEFDRALEQKLERRGWLGFGQHSGAIGRYSHETRLPRFPMADAYGQIKGLRDKLMSKAFPVPAADLPDGVIDRNPPELRFPLGDKLSANRLTCFASGFGRIDTQINGDEVSVQAPDEITSRRFRYNCTHPAGNGSFYWLSQQWLNLDAPED
ncbi:Peptidoglycan/xylan/chitin deacetylase, PgdA/CDA1 family [Marinobacter persicus]|uniref:Peptidoglycan/xylan/chitin deacetylase, PgdA/CDA1 family n=1 Tax=Marinobacter persicus TaxID=930118 RepID=A0A1I3TKC5_9GAMM|nr:polysaccharide deacetylase family protein [Marinobacter persicus]GHD46366.1 polysaccharide deacetylase [Marinobacter persicus]SFJ71070.1 Peptidoglycan/xylan/chitin deacetylase, PgdA/CDA1 family [Marinobacter persicus]